MLPAILCLDLLSAVAQPLAQLAGLSSADATGDDSDDSDDDRIDSKPKTSSAFDGILYHSLELSLGELVTYLDRLRADVESIGEIDAGHLGTALHNPAKVLDRLVSLPPSASIVAEAVTAQTEFANLSKVMILLSSTESRGSEPPVLKFGCAQDKISRNLDSLRKRVLKIRPIIDRIDAGKLSTIPSTERGDLNDEHGRVETIKPKSTRTLSKLTSIRSSACKLLQSLRLQWACSNCTAASHNKSLCSLRQAKLHLGPNWNSDMRDPLQFEILLWGPDTVQECEVQVTGQDPEPKSAICRISTVSTRKNRLKMVVGASNKLWEHQRRNAKGRFENLPRKLQIPLSFRKETSLKECIDKSTAFKWRERRMLAVVLGNSLLHLFNTPWLGEQWSKKDISFFYCEDKSLTFNLRHPYLSTTFGTGDGPDLDQEALQLRTQHEFPSLLSMAVVLLEIELGDRLRNIYKSDQAILDVLENPDDPNAPEELAKFLLQKYTEYYGPDKCLEAIIENCLYPTFLDKLDTSGNPYDHPEVRLAIYKNIVEPLAFDLFDPDVEVSTEWSKLDQLLLHHTSENPILYVDREFIPIDSSETSNIITVDNCEPSTRGLDNEVNQWYSNLESVHTYLKFIPTAPGRKSSRVKIAVLDTGIDPTHSTIKTYYNQNRIAEYYDFVEGHVSPKDPVGHGTHNAHLILKAAPTAKLFVGRVLKQAKADPNAASAVVRAIDYFVNTSPVDIISMSFGFGQEIPEIQAALRNASKKGVLIFAAASNNRHSESTNIAYPASVKGLVICINSHDGAYQRSRISPEGEIGRSNLSAIGEGLEAAWPSDSKDNNLLKKQSGTSCATPLAASVAALVLEFANRAEPRIHKAENLKDCRGMEKVMLKLMTKEYNNGLYNAIRPWFLFDAKKTDPFQRAAKLVEEAIDDLNTSA